MEKLGDLRRRMDFDPKMGDPQWKKWAHCCCYCHHGRWASWNVFLLCQTWRFSSAFYLNSLGYVGPPMVFEVLTVAIGWFHVRFQAHFLKGMVLVAFWFVLRDNQGIGYPCQPWFGIFASFESFWWETRQTSGAPSLSQGNVHNALRVFITGITLARWMTLFSRKCGPNLAFDQRKAVLPQNHHKFCLVTSPFLLVCCQVGEAWWKHPCFCLKPSVFVPL